MTLADCLFGSWAIGSATRLWPGLLGRLGWSWPFAAFAALLVPVAAGWRGPLGMSIGTVWWPAAVGAALMARLAPDDRRRTLEAALLSGLVLVLARAVAQSLTSVPAGAIAGLCAAVVAPKERTASAAALVGATVVPALLRTGAVSVGAATGAADDLAAAVAVSLGVAVAVGAVAPGLTALIRRDRA